RAVKHKGFVLFDEKGEVPLTEVEIVADTVVRLRAVRTGRPTAHSLCQPSIRRCRAATRQRPGAGRRPLRISARQGHATAGEYPSVGRQALPAIQLEHRLRYSD